MNITQVSELHGVDR